MQRTFQAIFFHVDPRNSLLPSKSLVDRLLTSSAGMGRLLTGGCLLGGLLISGCSGEPSDGLTTPDASPEPVEATPTAIVPDSEESDTPQPGSTPEAGPTPSITPGVPTDAPSEAPADTWTPLPWCTVHQPQTAVPSGLVGQSDYDSLGWGVQLADFNRDGYSDLLASAIGSDLGGEDAGSVQLWYGPLEGDSSRPPDATFVGTEPGAVIGMTLAVGDLNGDGCAEIAVGAPLWSPSPLRSGAGAVFLFQNACTPGLRPWNGQVSLSAATRVLTGEDSADSFGYSVANAGDLDRDGADELMIGAPYAGTAQSETGRVYLYYGGDSMLSSQASGQNVEPATFEGPGNSAWLGTTISGGGDFNGDGYGDVLLAANGNYQGEGFRGRTYALLGREDRLSGTANIETQAALLIIGADPLDSLGDLLIARADLNADGLQDIVLSAPHQSGRASAGGQVLSFFGRRTWTPGQPMEMLPLDQAGWRIQGDTDEAMLGRGLTSLADVNRDGGDELVVGAVGAASGWGEVYLFSFNAQSSSLTPDDAVRTWTGDRDGTDLGGYLVGEAQGAAPLLVSAAIMWWEDYRGQRLGGLTAKTVTWPSCASTEAPTP